MSRNVFCLTRTGCAALESTVPQRVWAEARHSSGKRPATPIKAGLQTSDGSHGSLCGWVIGAEIHATDSRLQCSCFSKGQLFFLVFFFLEYNCFITLCFCCTTMWMSYMYALSPPSRASFPRFWQQWAEFTVLPSSFPLAIYSCRVVCICQCYPLSLIHPRLPRLCPQVYSLSASLFLLCK